jgi:hypothetical protein
MTHLFLISRECVPDARGVCIDGITESGDLCVRSETRKRSPCSWAGTAGVR